MLKILERLSEIRGGYIPIIKDHHIQVVGGNGQTRFFDVGLRTTRITDLKEEIDSVRIQGRIEPSVRVVKNNS